MNEKFAGAKYQNSTDRMFQPCIASDAYNQGSEALAFGVKFEEEVPKNLVTKRNNILKNQNKCKISYEQNVKILHKDKLVC